MAVRRMKRLVLGMVVLASFAGYPLRADSIESATPNDCVFLVRFKSPAAFFHQLGQTSVGRAVLNSELGGSGAAMLSNGARFFSSLLMGVKWTQLRDEFGSDIAVVLFDTPPDFRGKPPAALVCDVSGHAARTKNLLEKTVLPRLCAVNKKLSLTHETYKNAIVYRLQERRKPPMYLAFVSSVFVVGNEAGVKKIIDGSKTPAATLASYEPYQTAAKQVAASPGGFCYFNTERLINRVRPQFSARPKKREGFAATGLLTVKAFAIGAEASGRGVRQRLAAVTAGETTGLMRLAGTALKTEPAAFRHAPADCQICVSAQFQDGSALVAALRQFLLDTAGEDKVVQIGNGLQALEQQFNISWQAEFVDALTGEAFVCLRLPNFAELALERRKPSPKDFDLLIGVGLRDESTVKATLDKIFNSDWAFNAGISVSPETCSGRQVTVISLANKPDFSPCYSIGDGALVFALSLETLEHYAESLREKRTLAASEDFQSGLRQLRSRGNVTLYVDAPAILTNVSQLLQAKAPAGLQGVVAELNSVSDAAFGMVVSVKKTDFGLTGEAYGPTPAAFGLAALGGFGELSKPRRGRRFPQKPQPMPLQQAPPAGAR